MVKSKKIKDPNKPKRPSTGYLYFLADQRKESKKRGEDTTKVAEWTKRVSGIWKELTDEEKKPFNALAAQDKARYDKEMLSYGGKRPKDANKPKRAQSAYFLFLADFRAKQKSNFAYEGGNKDLIRAAGEAWNKLSATEKAPFEKKHQVEREKYEKAMAEYTANSGAGGASAAKKVKTGNGAARDVEDDDDDEDDEDDDEEEESD